VAGDLMHMHVPDNKHIQIVFPDNAALAKAPQPPADNR